MLNPAVTVITNVDFDHVDQLGPTLREIAFHKAGIIKRFKPVITGASQRDVVRVKSINPSLPVEVYSDATEAIRQALERAKPEEILFQAEFP